MRRATNITYETDGLDVDLPQTLTIPTSVDTKEIADYISDVTGWLVRSYSLEELAKLPQN